MLITYDEQGGFLRGVLAGSLTVQDLQRAFLNQMRHPSFRPGINALWDMREASLAELTALDVERLATFIASHRAERGNGRVALLFSSPADYGLGRMYQTLAARGPSDVGVFLKVDEAESWVRT